jgi:hypothetical protein
VDGDGASLQPLSTIQRGPDRSGEYHSASIAILMTVPSGRSSWDLRLDSRTYRFVYAAERVVGDFNGDGRDDIALIGNSAWQYGRGRWY